MVYIIYVDPVLCTNFEVCRYDVKEIKFYGNYSIDGTIRLTVLKAFTVRFMIIVLS